MANQFDPRAGLGGMAMPGLQARYIPQFEERTSYGSKVITPIVKLFEERIIFLDAVIVDETANNVIAQLLVLESMDPDRDITLYINSPGGDISAMLAIYDTMQYVRPDVVTVCLGEASSAAAVLLAAGTKGKRACLPNSRVLIHQPRTGGGMQGQVSDLAIAADEFERTRVRVDNILARHTGKDTEVIRKDTDRDKFLSAEEAKDYGIVDSVFAYRKLSAQA
ncbi:ATP-dependent Clp protease proteolytic subunit [Nocardia sp. NPDC051832]|uniref:ATP-dependent Clp protease proteolytic subunit n=1 Tax=Nocardia sp. NPDC051832 TaxID=3155673 RepID=UPI00343F715C